MRSLAVRDSVRPTRRNEERLDVRRRRELIESTLTSIADNGLSGTTMAKVAHAAGLSPGIVNFYFHSKKALLLETLNYVAEEFERHRLEAIARAGEDPVRQLEAIIEADFDPVVCNPRWNAVWLAFWGEARARDDYMRVCGSRDESYLRQNVDLFERIGRDGGYTGLDLRALATAFTHMMSALPEVMLEKSNHYELAEFKATCRRYLSSVFPEHFSFDSAASIAPVDGQARIVDTAEEAPFLTLAAWTYENTDFYELEKEYIFRRHWLLVGHANEAPNCGDYMTLDIADERAFVIRGRDGVLRAFHNVCQHRASRVVGEGTGHCQDTIVCPYHGWSYGFDGALNSVPSEQTFSGLDRSTLALPELELDEWMGFVFVRFGGSGPPVLELMRPFEDELATLGIAEMKPWGPRWSSELNVNWKIAVENDVEGYRVGGSAGFHRLLGASERYEDGALGVSRSRLPLQAEPSSVFSERLYQALLPEHGSQHSDASNERDNAWIYYGLFPRTVIKVCPDLVWYYQFVPQGPDACRMQGYAVAREDDRREMRAARYLHQRINKAWLEEDKEVCEWTEAGMRSSGYRGGNLSETETGVRAMHDRIRELIPVASLPSIPPVRRIADLNEQMRGDRQ